MKKANTPLCSGCGPALQADVLPPCSQLKLEEKTDKKTNTYGTSFIIGLIAATALGPFAVSSFVPALPALQEYFDVSTSVVQLTISAAMLAMAAGSLVYGYLADRYGRRLILLLGVITTIIGSILCALASTIGWVIAGRCLQAIGSTVGFVLARVIVTDVYSEERSSSVLAYITAAMMIAPLFGPLAGGYFVDHFNWRTIFWITALVATLLFVLLLVAVPETRPSALREKTTLPNFHFIIK